MDSDEGKPEGYEERLAAVRAEKLAGIGTEPIPKKHPRPPNSMLGIQSNTNGVGLPAKQDKPKIESKKGGGRLLAPLIDRALVEAGQPIDGRKIFEAVEVICNREGIKRTSLNSIQGALPMYADTFGWRRGSQMPALWSKATPGIPADDHASRKEPTPPPADLPRPDPPPPPPRKRQPVRILGREPVDEQIPPQLKARNETCADASPMTTAQKKAHIDGLMTRLNDALIDMKAIREKLAYRGIILTDKFMNDMLEAETARQEAQAGSDGSTDD